MKTETIERRIYRVGPWRRALPWLIFGPLLLLAAGLWIFGATGEERSTGMLVCAILTVVTLGMHALIFYARLELTAEGVRLRQIGMNLASPWTDVAGLRLERGREGFVTLRPIGGSGAANLAAVRGFGMYGNPMYNDEQRAVMAERRWIPIEAFGWHLRRGRLREDLARLAPAVQPLPALLAPAVNPVSPAVERRRVVIILLAVGALVAAIVVLTLRWPEVLERAFTVLLALLAPLFAFRAGWSARNAFRSGAPWMGALFILLTLICVLWCVVAWSDVAAVFGGAR